MLFNQISYPQRDAEAAELGVLVIDNTYHEPDRSLKML